MNLDIKNIISKIQKNITCPICKRKFEISEIKINSIINNLIIFSVSCDNNHQPIKLVNLVIIQNSIELNDIKNSFLDEKNVDKIYKQIDNFNGDFIKLWKKQF